MAKEIDIEEEIELDEETGKRVIVLTKHINALKSQNKLMTCIHILMLIFCLILLLSFWQTNSPAASIMTIAVIIVELIDNVAYKIITEKNTKMKAESEKELQQIIDTAFRKGQLFDKTV